jgi:S1-C subfamily serine protease
MKVGARQAREGRRNSYAPRLRPITPDVARQLDLRGAEGVLVFGMEDESPAAEAGLQRGQPSLYGAVTIATG